MPMTCRHDLIDTLPHTICCSPEPPALAACSQTTMTYIPPAVSLRPKHTVQGLGKFKQIMGATYFLIYHNTVSPWSFKLHGETWNQLTCRLCLGIHYILSVVSQAWASDPSCSITLFVCSCNRSVAIWGTRLTFSVSFSVITAHDHEYCGYAMIDQGLGFVLVFYV